MYQLIEHRTSLILETKSNTMILTGVGEWVGGGRGLLPDAKFEPLEPRSSAVTSWPHCLLIETALHTLHLFCIFSPQKKKKKSRGIKGPAIRNTLCTVVRYHQAFSSFNILCHADMVLRLINWKTYTATGLFAGN